MFIPVFKLIKMKSILIPLLLFALMMPAGISIGHAGAYRMQRRILRQHRRQHPDRHRVSEQRAVFMVERRTGGRVLAVRRVDSGYRIKVLTQQRSIRIIHVNARTGAMTQGR